MHSDVVFIHPPSIYDFRSRQIDPGPISDVIPSTPVFEMYPVGFVSMLTYLIEHGYSARIANIAVRMLDSKKFDPEAYIRDMDSPLFGIDLHWLPHAQGAIEVARIIKNIFPESKIVFGGYSATYFRKEIMKNYNFVDYVLSGDFQEEGILKLIEAIESRKPFEQVPGLVYRENGLIKENPRYDYKTGLNNVFFNYEILFKNAIKYYDIKGHLPYLGWIKNPESFTLLERGCELNCAFCGGSNFAYKANYATNFLIRDQEKVADEILLSENTLGSPIFMAGDLALKGPLFYDKFFRAIKDRGIDIPILTEYFKPFNQDYISKLSKTFPDFSIEISPETSNEVIRNWNKSGYTNAELEKSLELSELYGAKKFDMYFSIGLSHQDREDVKSSLDYAISLMKKYHGKQMIFSTFISPIAPFIDPGSLWYEKSDVYGFKIYGRSIPDIYQILNSGKTWRDFLDYETNWMTKDDIVESTYDSEITMTNARYELGELSKSARDNIIQSINNYRVGNGYSGNGRMDRHLAYIDKDIQWSRKHKTTLISMLIKLYSYYDSLEKT